MHEKWILYHERSAWMFSSLFWKQTQFCCIFLSLNEPQSNINVWDVFFINEKASCSPVVSPLTVDFYFLFFLSRFPDSKTISWNISPAVWVWSAQLSSTDEEDLSIASCGSGVLMTFPEVAHSMLSLCSSRRSRQDRSPSVEIIYEGTITPDGAQPPAHKRRRKRHRKAQQSRYEVSHCWEGKKSFVLARYTNSYSWHVKKSLRRSEAVVTWLTVKSVILN